MAIVDERPADDLTDRAAVIARALLRIRIVGWSLALGWLCVLVSMLALGEREGSFDRLESGLLTGDVSEVELVGGLRPGERGQATVSLRWRDGLVTRTATATEASKQRPTDDPEQRVIVGSVEDYLVALDPDVRVVGGDDVRRYSHSVHEWYVPGWLALVSLWLLVSTLMLISGPRPWRATRWAWAWLVLMVPLVGVPAYFLFGGPLGLFRPKDPHRVALTGGWAFLLGLLLGGGSAAG